MRYLYIFTFTYLIFFNHISYADISINGTTYTNCIYQGTVINLNKNNNLGIELLINIKDNLSSKSNCLVPLNENISLSVLENKEIEIGSDIKFSSAKVMSKEVKIGSDVKFSANKFIKSRAKEGELKDTAGFIFYQWE